MRIRKSLVAVLAVPALLAALVLPSAAAQAAQGAQENIDVKVTIPDAGSFQVTDAQFRWGVNTEMTSGSFFGGCNFLSAGIAADAGSSRVWDEPKGLYSAKDGNSRVEKPNAQGKWGADSWDTKCQDASGRQVGTGFDEPGTGAQIVVEKGEGSVDAAKGTAEISWEGSFSLVMYGGMTYWSLSDPVLTVANGKGKLTATASGFASDREDTTKWNKLADTTITMAELPKVSLGNQGIISTPAYTGVKVEGMDQVRDMQWWGSFPASWVKFNEKTGQAAYWYSSGGSRDKAKVATDVYISYTPQNPVLEKPEAPVVPKTDPEDESGAGVPKDSNGGQTPLGQDGKTAPLQSALLQQAAAALVPPLSKLTGAGTSVLEAATMATSAINWLGKSLIPQAIERAMDYRQGLLWSLAGLLALSSAAWVGFRRGWLIWPFSSKQEDQNGNSPGK